jgi:hypothetical protein
MTVLLKHHSFILSSLSFIFFISAIAVSSDADAVPAFARQTTNECSACHYQHFPKLKPFGRNFKANGYSLSSQEQLEGDGLSVPMVLNASFFMRSAYTSKSGSARNELAIPNEAALLVGGRLANGIGGIVEWGGPLLSAKISFTKAINKNRIGATIFTTDGLGAAYGYELMNTGAVRNHRAFGNSSMPTLGNNDNLNLSEAATGATLFFSSTPSRISSTPTWYVANTFFTPDSGEAGITELDVNNDVSNYFRAAMMSRLSKKAEGGLGLGIYSGKTITTLAEANFMGSGLAAGDEIILNTSAWFIDAQLQGKFKGKDLGVYFMYAEGDTPSTTPGEVNMFASTTVGDKKPTGWGVDAEYSVTPQVHLLASLGEHDNGGAGSAKSSAGLGVFFFIKQNINLELMHERFGGEQGKDPGGKSASETSLILEAAF